MDASMSWARSKMIPSLNDAEPVIFPSHLPVPANRFATHDAVYVDALQECVLVWPGKRSHHNRPFASVENRYNVSRPNMFPTESDATLFGVKNLAAQVLSHIVNILDSARLLFYFAFPQVIVGGLVE